MSGHTRSPGFEPGNHWNTCMRCGMDMRQSESNKEWNNLIVCEDCFEPRHPQDFVEAPVDDTAPKGLVTSELVGTNVELSLDVGDSDVTLTPGISSQRQGYSTTLTANRTVTLSTSGAINGSWFRIERYELSAYTIDVGGLATMPASTKYYVEVLHNGTTWTLLNSGAL